MTRALQLSRQKTECLGAVLIARSHSRRVQERAREAGISLLRYETCLSDEPCTFGEIVSSLRLERSQSGLHYEAWKSSQKPAVKRVRLRAPIRGSGAFRRRSSPVSGSGPLHRE